MRQQCEVLVVPQQFACVMFHYQIDNSIPVPIGLLSVVPEFVEKATALLTRLTSSPQEVYSLKWKDRDSATPIDFFGDRESSSEDEGDISAVNS